MRLVTIASFAAALLGLIPVDARADLLQLANGDHLQGRLLAREAGLIRWESPLIGVVTVPEAHATVIAEPAHTPPAATGTRPPPAAAQRNPAPPPATAAGAPPDTATRRTTTIETGLTLQSGRNDRADVNLRAETNLRRGRDDFRLQARYLYSKAAGTVTSDRADASFRVRREFGPHWFGQSTSSYYSSKVKGIDDNVEQNLGLGYRLIKTERTTASFGAGLAGQYREVVDAAAGKSLFGELFQDFAIKLTPRLDLGEDFTAHYSPSGRGIRVLPSGQAQIIDTSVSNYRLTLKAFLRGKLTDTLSLALRYEYEFDNTYVTSGEKSDQRITTTLGYTF